MFRLLFFQLRGGVLILDWELGIGDWGLGRLCEVWKKGAEGIKWDVEELCGSVMKSVEEL